MGGNKEDVDVSAFFFYTKLNTNMGLFYEEKGMMFSAGGNSMMRKTGLLIAAICLSLVTGISSFAGQWVQGNGVSWYQNDDGSYPADCWQWIDGNGDGIAECYYFDANGYCLMNGTAPDGNQVNENGAWVIDGVVQTKIISQEVSDIAAGIQSVPQGVQSASGAALLAGSGVVAGNVQQSAADGGGEKKASDQTRNTGSSSGGTASYQNIQESSVGVYITKTGSKYHNKPNCGTTKNAKKVSKSAALSNGYEACKKCYR